MRMRNTKKLFKYEAKPSAWKAFQVDGILRPAALAGTVEAENVDAAYVKVCGLLFAPVVWDITISSRRRHTLMSFDNRSNQNQAIAMQADLNKAQILRIVLADAIRIGINTGRTKEQCLCSFGRGYLQSPAPRLTVINRALQFAQPPIADLLSIRPTVVFVDADGIGIAAPAPLEGVTRAWAKSQQVQFFGEIDVATGRTVVYE